MKKHLFLVGFMGSGKTTTAQRLGNLTQCQFIDTDQFIEQMEGIPISTIFLRNGEQKFRTLENHCLRLVIATPRPLVVSTGGGLPCHSSNMELMRRAGLVIYLRLSAQALTLRLQGEVSKRPLLNNLNGQPLNERIESLLAARSAYYEQAHLTIDANHLSTDELAENILLLLE